MELERVDLSKSDAQTGSRLDEGLPEGVSVLRILRTHWGAWHSNAKLPEDAGSESYSGSDW